MPTKHADQLRDQGTQELLAMIEVMYLVAQADGYFSPQERHEFLEHVESLSEGKVGSHQLSMLVDRWMKEEPSPVEPRLKSLASLLPDDTSRRIAYGLACEIADADGSFLAAEEAVLRKIAQAFELPADDSEQIAESVRMYHRPQS